MCRYFTKKIHTKSDVEFFIQLNFIEALSTFFNCQTLFSLVEIYCLVVILLFDFPSKISLSFRRIGIGDSYFKLNVSTIIMLLFFRIIFCCVIENKFQT